MITTLTDTPFVHVFLQARQIASFNDIRSALLASLASAGFSPSQQLAIRLAGAQMVDPGHMPSQIDKLLISVLNIQWEDVGADGTEALTSEQRAGILYGIMAVCKQIIADEAARLDSLAQTETVLPAGWSSEDEA